MQQMWFVLLSISRYKLVISCRSSTSPWSWRRPSGEPTTASRCPTSSATYPCREQELVRPRGQRFRAHLLQLRLKTKEAWWLSAKSPCDCLKVTPTLPFTSHPADREISLPPPKTNFVFMSFFSFLCPSPSLSFSITNLEPSTHWPPL